MKKTKKLSFLLMVFCLMTMLLMPVSVNAAAKLNKKTLSLNVKKTYTLKVTGTSKKIKWTSSNSKVASVSQKGVVKGVKAGKCTITAKYGKKKLTCKVTVKQPLISASTTNVNFTSSKQKAVKITYTGSKSIWWSSGNTNIVTGKWKKGWSGDVATLYLIPKGNGTTTVKIYDDNKKKTVTINVTVNVQEFVKEPVQKLGTELKNIGVTYEGTYAIAKEFGSTGGIIVQYDEGKGTICFSFITLSGSSSTSIQMTVYKNSDKCYLYINSTDGSGLIEVEKYTTRSNIRKSGYIQFEYTEMMKNLMSVLGEYEPTAREQSLLNRVFRTFLGMCEKVIPGTYSGRQVTVTMNELFPNY